MSASYSVAEAATHFGVTTATIRNWITNGVIRAERVGPKLIRVDIDSLRGTPIGAAQ